MKLETFFEKFELLADAPDAVAKMRALVLNLAVQGRLVSNCGANPLSAEQIATEKQRRMRELKIRSHPETPQPTETDFPFSLPKSWHAVTLGDLAFSCPTSYGAEPTPSLLKAGVVKVGNIDNQGGFKGSFSERGFLPDEIESLLARRGDLMVVKSSGSAENVHSGKTALCTIEHDGKIVGTNFVLRLRLLGTPALPEYVWRVLTSRYSRAWIEGTVQTMTYPNLKWYDFARLPIPLPPLAEQKRIVAKVDELMAVCDRMEAQQQERQARHADLARASLTRFAEAPTSANLDFLFHPAYDITPADLRKSILTLAVQGKLVQQDPNEKPAAQSFHGLKTLPHESSETAGVPDQWALCSYRSLTSLVTSGSRGWKEFYAESGSIFVRTQNIKTDKLVLDDVAFVELPKSTEGMRAQVLKNDILITITGANVTKAARVVEQIPEAYISQHIALTRPKWPEMSEWLHLCFISHGSARGVLEQLAYGDKPGLNLNNIRDLELPIAPLAEQRRIVAKVNQLMALVDQLEAQLATAKETGSHLLKAIVAELSERQQHVPPATRDMGTEKVC